MSRPEWAAAGTFAEAWRVATWAATASHGGEWHRAFGQTACTGLRLAHVISLSREQVDALPGQWATYAESAAAFRDTRLPFDPVYLSLDRATLPRFDPPGRLLGALVGTPHLDDGNTLDGKWDGVQPWIMPFYDSPAGGIPPTTDSWCFAGGEGWVGSDLFDQLGLELSELGHELSEQDRQQSRSLKVDAAEVVANVLYFLESANVQLVEAQPSRQERRSIERKSGRIALTVAIRQPKRRPQAAAPGQHPEWSHRWEVRGHYKHFPAGTRLADSADPAKLVIHPSIGQCRRIWCPPYVKGPQDKPLVPKVRVVAPGNDAATDPRLVSNGGSK